MSLSRQIVQELPLPDGRTSTLFYPLGKALPYKYHLQQLQQNPTASWGIESSQPGKETPLVYKVKLYWAVDKEQPKKGRWSEFDNVESALDYLQPFTDGRRKLSSLPLM